MTGIDETFAGRTGHASATSGAANVPPVATGARAAETRGLHPDAVAAIMAATHGDPFSVLGPHEVGPGAWEVRAVLPEAKGATLLTGGKRIPFERKHPDGFFVARVESQGRPLYELAVEDWDGTERNRHDPYGFGSSLEQHDIDALREVGSNVTYRILGAQAREVDGIQGFRFAVWAPNARRVSVVGDFNAWDGRRHPMRLWQNGGVWELFVPGLKAGAHYKFELLGPDGTVLPLKADPVAFAAQKPPETASV
ncbi:MAG: 1,4-alpha-glucan branching enzyme, partial [Methylobacterium sp.]